jgi:hypothetical protein
VAIDTPAKLGIIGAGPTGLETCLYARFLGYEVLLFESDVAGHRWDSDESLGNFGDFSSTLGRAAIVAQDFKQPLPLLTQRVTRRQWRDLYLLPLAECDLIVDSLLQGQKVVRVSKEHLNGNEVTGFDRGGYDFIVETIDGSGAKQCHAVDALVDASGWTVDSAGEPTLFNYELSLELKRKDGTEFPPQCADFGHQLPDGTILTAEAKKLVLHEPNFYVLGEKAEGAETLKPERPLVFTKILEQIRALFTILGDRTSLDLYATAVTLPQ